VDEDDGYIMTFVYDGTKKTSDFVMYDCKTLELVHSFEIEQRVPHGFHSIFVAEDLIE
jgi:carotenoid cleavage dioxygenase-like enzyme